jgi:hypothetical protein
MVCPHNSNKTEGEDGRRGIERRQFVLSAVAIGGTSALAACLDREDSEPESGNRSGTHSDSATLEQNERQNSEADDNNERQNSEDNNNVVPFEYQNLPKEQSQYAWNQYLDTTEHGRPKPPRHRVLVLADYTDSDPPSERERTEMEQSLQMLEEAYEWSNRGLLFTVSYSPAYFSQFQQGIPEEVNLPEPTPLAEFESPVLDEYDVCFHLASDHAQAVLSAEEALFGNIDVINGVTVEWTLDGILEKRERRTGFIGAGLPADNQDVAGIPDSQPVDERAPLYMGFQAKHTVAEEHPYHGETEATYLRNQNSEFGVMIKEGRFEGGTTQQVSKIQLNLRNWYNDYSLEERAKRAFGSVVTIEEVGEVGEDERPRSHFPDPDVFEGQIKKQDVVGHGTKLASMDSDGPPPLLRRDFNTTDDNHAGVHFVSLQESISDFVATRQLMNGDYFHEKYDGIEEQENNGILEFMTVTNRANFLIPPRDLRSLPQPTPQQQ